MKNIINYIILVILKTIGLFIRKKDVVIIGTYSRYRYAGNTKYLYEYLSQHTDLQVYWLTESREIMEHLELNQLKYLTNTQIMNKILMTLKCRVIIDSGTGYYDPFNYFSTDKAVLKISTMHGSGPKLTVERKNNISETLNLIKKINTFSCVGFCTEHSRVTIGVNQLLLSREKTKLLGLPKHDLLINQKYTNKIYNERKWSKKIIGSEIGIAKSKIIYYTPTFRTIHESLPINKLSGFTVKKFEDFLEEKDIYFIYSFHSMNNFTDDLPKTKRIKFVTNDRYPLFDNFELMLESDMMIGDYSTLATDFSLLKRPQLFIIPDYNQVYESKGFAEDLRSMLPGKEVNSYQELHESISKYINNESLFLSDFKSKIEQLHLKYVSQDKKQSRMKYQDYISKNLSN